MSIKKYSKEEAIEIITKCAKQYQTNLEEKVLFVIFQNIKDKSVDYIELHFHDRNFLHLTGLKLNPDFYEKVHDDSAAILFYKKCLDHKLSPNDFNFSEDGTTHLKLMVLPTLLVSNLSAKMIGNFNNGKPRLVTDKLTGNISGCMGFINDKTTNTFLPNTVINEDIRDVINPINRVIGIFRKNEKDEKYNEITYLAKKVDWAHIHINKEYQYLVDLCI